VKSAEIAARIRKVAERLAGAPAATEEAAKRHAEAHQAAGGRWPHQVGGLEQICSEASHDLEAIIRTIGGVS